MLQKVTFMKNIKAKHLNKYDTNKFEKVKKQVYKNKLANNYCFAYEGELEENEGQYPLEDLLELFKLRCTEDFCIKEEYIGGIKKQIVEVETSSDSKKDLKYILNFSNIIGKTVENVELCEAAVLVINCGMGKIILDGKVILLPILAERINPDNTFNIIYGEEIFIDEFKNGVNISGAIPKDCEIRYILLTSNVSFTKKAIGLCALVIYNINEKTYGLMYSKLGPREENRIEILKEAKFLETILMREKQ